ncbi:hypothetical protein CUJ83_08910 [Methanocella sp. CWC-04]|uniref:Carboxypeptidase regulatory-like domain-containing protein n=1 Tax=Methanooceanicella nereidis TaxID=2052831 RepID=A0AAP2RE47_9EURY|nr:hypothetical protein [Methanocella sp. CWC-04]MCD1295116.1 hypothetical protein [Methanocella sp. CWC-04]
MNKSVPVIIGFLAILILSANAIADDNAYNKLAIHTSQPCLRAGMDDNLTITVTLMNGNERVNMADVPIFLKVLKDENAISVDRLMIITDDTGSAFASVKLADGYEISGKDLPLLIQITASADRHMTSTNINITDMGSINGYVIDDRSNTILNASIKVYSQDGTWASYIGDGEPFYSSNGTNAPMGTYSIEGIPLGTGKFDIVAEKNGYTGSIVFNGIEKELTRDIIIRDFIDDAATPVPYVTGMTNSGATVQPSDNTEKESVPMPTPMTNTVLIVIAIVTVAYAGLKVYRKMFR